MTARITRLAPGEYEVTAPIAGWDEPLVVTVSRLEHLPSSGPQWIAAAQWDRYCVTDPCWTLADAKQQAAWMLADAAILDGGSLAPAPLEFSR